MGATAVERTGGRRHCKGEWRSSQSASHRLLTESSILISNILGFVAGIKAVHGPARLRISVRWRSRSAEPFEVGS
jgi:hypothetical protein